MSRRYNSKTSSLYYIIGYYQKLAKILSKIESVQVNAKSKELYISYWQLLIKLEDAVFAFSSSELWHLFKLEDMMISSLEASLNDFKNSGIKTHELVAQIDKIITHLDSLAFSNETTSRIRLLKERLKIIEEKLVILNQTD